MRKILSLALLISLIACSSNNQQTNLDGVWIPVSQEIGGVQLPEAAFSSQRLELNGNEYTMTAESVDKGTSTVDGNKMDISGKEGPNAGKTFKAIYKLEGDVLTICYNLNGDSYPETFSTQDEPMFFMASFEKMKE